MLLSFVFWLLLSSQPQAVTPLSLPKPNLIFSSDPLLLNRSTSSNAKLSFPWFLPHPWDDRETRMHYQFGFGVRRVTLDRSELQALLAIAQETAYAGSSESGQRTRYPVEDGEQRFSVNSGVLELRIANHGGGYFTWGFLENILRGLELFLIGEGRLYKTWFAVWAGLATTGRPEVARGKLFKVVQEVDES